MSCFFKKNNNYKQILQEKQNKYNNDYIQINHEYLAKAINLTKQIQNVHGLRKHQKMRKVIKLGFKAYDLEDKKLIKAKLEWFKLGSCIWGLSGLKNFNVTGFSSLALSMAKQAINVILPTIGAYPDITINITMGVYCKNGIFNMDRSIKDASSYKELQLKYKALTKQILANIDSGNLTTEEIHNIQQKINQVNLEHKKQNANLRHVWFMFMRSFVRIVVTTTLVILLAATGGISLPINIAIILLGQAFYMLACGQDTITNNQHSLRSNLEYGCFLKDPNKMFNDETIIVDDIDTEKAQEAHSTQKEIQNKYIQSIYTHKLAKIQNKIDKNSCVNCVKHQKQYQSLIRKRENLLHDIDIYEGKILSWDCLDKNSCITKSLLSKQYLITRATSAEYKTEGILSGQIIKNYGANVISIGVNAEADGCRYGLEDVNNNLGHNLFATSKPFSGISSAVQRPFASNARKKTKHILQKNIDYELKIDKNNLPITQELQTKNGYIIDISKSTYQTKRIKSTLDSTIKYIKSTGITCASIISTPIDFIATNLKYKQVQSAFNEAKVEFANNLN